MPLETGKSREAFSRNVATEMHAGKPQKQAVAIAYAQERRGDTMDTKIDAVADNLRRAADGVDALEKRMVRGDATGKHGVWFGARELSGGKWGIKVWCYRNGSLETEDQNTTPWPNEKVALERAERTAKTAAEQDNLPFKGKR